jgi:hypothetical protein
MHKKTVKVKDLINRVNKMLDISTCSQEIRYGMIAVLETVLHDTGTYVGYNHILEGQICSSKEQPDDSRRHYYISRNI